MLKILIACFLIANSAKAAMTPRIEVEAGGERLVLSEASDIAYAISFARGLASSETPIGSRLAGRKISRVYECQSARACVRIYGKYAGRAPQ